jgi:hypothetical protein
VKVPIVYTSLAIILYLKTNKAVVWKAMKKVNPNKIARAGEMSTFL